MSATTSQLLAEPILSVGPADRVAAAEVDGWLQDYADTRDPALRERIILAYLGLADRLAGRYRSSRGTTPQDLTQIARTGLIAAVDRYDPARAVGFAPFAVACVVGELKRHLRDTTWRLHVPRPVKERALRLCKATDELHQTLGRPPTTAELARHLEFSEEEVQEASQAATSRLAISLDQPVGQDETALGDLMAAPGPNEQPEDLLALPGLVQALPERERTVIVLRFFDDLDQYAIAARIGCSQMHVSRLLRRALARMHNRLVEP